MEINEKNKLINKIIELYDVEENEIKNLSIDELKTKLNMLEKKQAFINKNPNSFFYIKSLPLPKKVKQINSTIPGWIIFFIFILLLASTFVIFLILALI
ncbi:hypothetical protein [[Mycoplasma] collis]|uniref:hypothetical protein n=1 Tax=[Mycoplasma] collis TaxID=2127 RepID=UPI00051C6626|nr:hypothetical protein [[Mycoplasma] collis]